jgi:hypothetical protein
MAPLDRSDLSGQAIKCAVYDFQDARHQGRIMRDDLVQGGGGALGVFDRANDLGGDLGEGRDGRDLLDRLLNDLLRIDSGRGGHAVSPRDSPLIYRERRRELNKRSAFAEFCRAKAEMIGRWRF